MIASRLWNQATVTVFWSLCVFTCVALASSWDQAIVFACSVDITSIQSDGVGIFVL